MKKILLIVDMQSKFRTKENEYLYENIKDIDFSKYEKIYATKFINNIINPNFKKLLNFNIVEDKLSLKDFDYIEIEKGTYGLPYNLIQQFKEENIEQIDIVGTDYDSCVLAIGFQIFDMGIVPKFYKNLIGTHSVNSIDFEILQNLYIRNFGKDCFI